ncbi:MAG: LysM domain-containing protein [Anaerolineaceae bacterium]
MKMQRLLLLLITATLLGGCVFSISPAPTAVPRPTNTALPLPSDTPAPATATPTLTPSPTPTGTPVYYQVDADDDMFGISLRYGISLDALMTANPTVIPYAMGVGTLLLIPITQTAPAPSSTPAQAGQETPQPGASLQTDCYRDKTGGVLCFALAVNDTEKDKENVSAKVTLTSEDGEYTRTQTAILPLNLLKAGQSLPLITYFQAPTPEKFNASAVIDFSLPVPENDARYLSAQPTELEVSCSREKLSCAVSGRVLLSPESAQADTLWVLVVAYSLDGRVAGIRRWDAQTPAGSAAVPLDFSALVYSAGPEIERVEVFAEARPIQ